MCCNIRSEFHKLWQVECICAVGIFHIVMGLSIKCSWYTGFLLQSMCADKGNGKGGRVSLAVHKRMLQRRKGISLTLEQKLELGARREPGTSLLR